MIALRLDLLSEGFSEFGGFGAGLVGVANSDQATQRLCRNGARTAGITTALAKRLDGQPQPRSMSWSWDRIVTAGDDLGDRWLMQLGLPWH
ncbi:unnamed protein product [Fusarium graminearum]|uniref:Uncharacterized protein n=1 Tax=Gibberella zeae TaxID=5518 RepID=A0A4E9ECQ8_GIBZA|nr:hypothetical protein HG531_009470 [Fusarium graminearum]CAF3456494.1 unnamed protein product [Fusarium graminearum]CAF3526965.1 unnamed protein product [Fusarium graminearum]CAG1962998.1 unnamed protein product [Fusarium graminearum]CAG1982118.1 unnamed protein product [Fusarium graminearum]